MTSYNTNWDVEKHKLEYECDEHWELRKRFLETHKEKFPEDQLVCLAQVFTNIELLGCKYPQETMDLVAELSQDVAKDYRERQKNKLKRTFVKASDAASAKAKGQKSTHIGSASTSRDHNSSDSQVYNIDYPRKRVNNNSNPPHKRVKIDINPRFGNIVILKYPANTPICTLDCSVRMSGQNLQWKFENTNNQCRCEIFINDKKLTEAIGNNKKSSKAEAAKAGLVTLQEYYYTIEVKKFWKNDLNAKQCELKLNDEADNNQMNETIVTDSIGAKLMRLMGWAGGGLGKSEQGITEPVTLQRQISRRGFGLKLNQSNMFMFKKKCQQTLRRYIQEGDTQNYLVFSDFSNEERAVMHECARKLGLKSESHGPKDNRTLYISRRVEPMDLVAELLENGGDTDKYTLIPPTHQTDN